MALSVECKNLNPSIPLVICGTTRQGTEAFHDMVLSTGPGAVNKFIGKPVVEPSSITQRAHSSDIYPVYGFVGKSTLRLKPENQNKPSGLVGTPDSEIYEKWAQALSSGVGLVEEACHCARQNQSIWSVILPVVVVSDDSLWRVLYDQKGTASTPEQVGQCEYYVGHQILVGSSAEKHPFTFSHIHFFTLSTFASFLSKLAVNHIAWANSFPIPLAK